MANFLLNVELLLLCALAAVAASSVMIIAAIAGTTSSPNPSGANGADAVASTSDNLGLEQHVVENAGGAFSSNADHAAFIRHLGELASINIEDVDDASMLKSLTKFSEGMKLNKEVSAAEDFPSEGRKLAAAAPPKCANAGMFCSAVCEAMLVVVNGIQTSYKAISTRRIPKATCRKGCQQMATLAKRTNVQLLTTYCNKNPQSLYYVRQMRNLAAQCPGKIKLCK